MSAFHLSSRWLVPLSLLAIAVISLLLWRNAQHSQRAVPPAGEPAASAEGRGDAESSLSPAAIATNGDTPAGSAQSTVTLEPASLAARREALAGTNGEVEDLSQDGQPAESLVFKLPSYRPAPVTPRSTPPTPTRTIQVPPPNRDSSAP